MPYSIGIWEMVALVILPFLFGILFGMHVYEKRMIIKLIKKLTPEELGKLMERENK